MGRSASRWVLPLLTAGTPGLRRIRRPATPDSPAFDLHYVRTGPPSESPVVIIPGGPGLGSILAYRGLRRRAARGGLDVVMVEHRGVGRSRLDVSGADLPVSAMRIDAVLDDLVAVLDHEGVGQAHIVGSSYGSYLASGFGVRHPERVAGMLLDSALQTASELELERRVLRERFWEGADPIPTLVRALVAAGENPRPLLDIVRAAYELGGDALLEPLLRGHLSRRRRGMGRGRGRGRRGGLAWAALDTYATRDDSIAGFPGIYEFDLAGVIGFRELDYGAPPDGRPFDPALTYAPLAPRFPAYAGEPFDLPAQTPAFTWPLVVLTGTRDLRTPPEIAERLVATAQRAVHVHLDNGHSALDTHPMALLNAIRCLVTGRQDELPRLASALDRLPHRGLSARLPALLAALLRIERIAGPRGSRRLLGSRGSRADGSPH